MSIVAAQATRTGAGVIRHLRGLVLLGGSVRPTRMGGSIGRPVFELPLDATGSILTNWRREAAQLARAAECEVPVRVMIDRNAPAAPSTLTQGAVGDLSAVEIERDPFDYRGTGGVLRDLAVRYADDDLLVVANAAQVLSEPLDALVREMAAAGGDVCVVSHADGVPSGLMLVRCGAMRDVAEAGFVDMKEQALPGIAARHKVSVVERATATGLPIRTLADYIGALRRHHLRKAGKADRADGAFAEDWEPIFGVVEEGAEVEEGARLHDSVVLKGGRAMAGAVLVHSVVCPAGVARMGQMVVDDLVIADDQVR